MKITAADIAKFEDHPEYNGWGYIGHSHRTGISDAQLAEAASDLKLPLEDVFLWANSRPGRHFMDVYSDTSGAYRRFCDELLKQLPSLRAEVGR